MYYSSRSVHDPQSFREVDGDEGEHKVGFTFILTNRHSQDSES